MPQTSCCVSIDQFRDRVMPPLSRPIPFAWTRTETLALASQSCAACWGMGLVDSDKRDPKPCKCVLRRIFTICYNKFRHCVESEQSHISSEAGDRKRYGYKKAEYVADFLHIASTSLIETRYQLVFKWHFLLGADFRMVNRKLGRPLADRSIFHDFYRIEEIVGRALRETQPYSLYPVDEYFGGTVRKAKVIPFPTTAPAAA